MEQHGLILTLDQGTTSSRAILFDLQFNIVHLAQQEYPQHYPQQGWVEHDPDDLLQSSLNVLKQGLAAAQQLNQPVLGIGLVNQRETTLVWDKRTGKSVYNAIVWQDRRTARACKALQSYEATVQQKTGLRLDPYFSASKIQWILNHVTGARAAAQAGHLLFGTVDSYLIWHLTGGTAHLTDTTNASRTNLFNLSTLQWDPDLLALFDIPASMLPEVKNCADDFGCTDARLVGERIPLCGVAGDQQAALIGQGCLQKGQAKTTYGTGCFALINSGTNPTYSQHNLLTTVAYTLNGQSHYAVEGAIFVAGAAVQWLRDSLGILSNASQSEAMASQIADDHGVIVVPAFTGLGAPYWEPDARGAIYGLTRGSSPAHLVRATLESVCFQTQDLFNSIAADGIALTNIRVDGGMVQNSWFCQYLADTLGVPVVRPRLMETTAVGAGYLAALQLGLRKSLADFTELNPAQSQFTPQISVQVRHRRYLRWQAAIQATLLMTGELGKIE